MPRIARKYLESCYFHVIVQGYEKQYIFESDKFIRKYLELLFDNLSKFKVTILAYCIMNNHAHILLYCEKTTEMSLYMKSVNTQYAMFYNKIKRRVGYVFRDRFLSEAINNVRYLYSCLNYIHMNPVAANIVRKPNQYKFSSYQNFLNKDGIVTDYSLKLLFGSSEDYMELFKFIHYSVESGMEFVSDKVKINDAEAKNIINDTLKESVLSMDELYDEKILRYLINKIKRLGVSGRQIERILKIDHRKMKRILESASIAPSR